MVACSFERIEMSKILYGELSYEVMNAAVEVHKELGPGLLERAYHECMCEELDLREIEYKSKVPVPVIYKGRDIGVCYEADLVVENTIVLEFKAVQALTPLHEAQLMTYMRLLGMPVGYALNFHVPKLMTKGRG